MAASLMSKLLDIERSAGYVDALEIRRMAMEAQTLLLELQQRYADGLSARVAGLTERANAAARRNSRLPRWPAVSRELQPQPANRTAASALQAGGIEEPSWARG